VTIRSTKQRRSASFFARVVAVPQPESRRLSPSFSFEQVYRSQAGFVRASLTRQGLSSHSLDDALQDVFVVVFRRMSEFTGGNRLLRSWLYSIARRVASHHHRTVRRSRARELVEGALVDTSPCPLERIVQDESSRCIAVLLASLGADKAKLIVLADVEERSVPEIATLTGTNSSTVYTRLRRARLELRTRVSSGLSQGALEL
jgi:RNA polymerase sigma-70 factor (ECF subfamily)